METNTTPAEVAAAVQPFFKGKIIRCKIAEDMHGMWDVRAIIKPTGKRRATFEHSECGETREEAIANFIEKAPFAAAVSE